MLSTNLKEKSAPTGSLPARPASVVTQLAPLAVVFLFACLVFFAELGKYPLFNPDEALYAEPAREMLDTGEYVTTLLNYVVRYTKPPLVIWAMALAYHVFGVNEFAARFFCAASGAILVACTYCFMARYTSARAAIFGSATLIMAPLFVGAGRMSITDMPLSLFIAGSMFSFYRAFRDKDGAWRWIAYVLIGLAVMTKGPVGVVLPIISLALYHFFKRDWQEALRFYKPACGALVVALIALPWFVTEIIVTRGEYFYAFILRENFQRFTSVVDHKAPWWYHIAAMMGGYFPWSVFLPQALLRAVLPDQVVDPRGGSPARPLLLRYTHLSGRGDALLFAAVFALVTLVFFSASVSKLLPYTLPAFPALALIVGVELERILQERAMARLLAPLAVLAIIYGAAGLVAPAALGRLRDAPPDLLAIAHGYVSFMCFAVCLALVLGLARKQPACIAALLSLTLCGSSYCGLKSVAAIAGHWEAPLPGLSAYAALSGWPVVVFDMRKPGVPFYAHKHVIQPPSDEALETVLKQLPHACVLTKSKRQGLFDSLPGFRIVTREGQFMLVEWRRPGG